MDGQDGTRIFCGGSVVKPLHLDSGFRRNDGSREGNVGF